MNFSYSSAKTQEPDINFHLSFSGVIFSQLPLGLALYSTPVNCGANLYFAVPVCTVLQLHVRVNLTLLTRENKEKRDNGTSIVVTGLKVETGTITCCHMSFKYLNILCRYEFAHILIYITLFVFNIYTKRPHCTTTPSLSETGYYTTHYIQDVRRILQPLLSWNPFVLFVSSFITFLKQ